MKLRAEQLTTFLWLLWLGLDNSSGVVTAAVQVDALRHDGTLDVDLHRRLSGDYAVPAATPEAPTYDADGNLLTCDGWSYTWNAQDRLVSATKGDVRLEFNYDYMGRRFEKKVYEDNALVKHLKFVYDGFKQIAEYDALASNALENTYLWQPVGLDVPLLRNNDEFFVSDANKNIVALIATTGSTTDTYTYAPFGNCTHAGLSDNPFRFSSEYSDEETVLVYYNYRYYSPVLGCWLSRDPMEETQLGDNLYIFVKNATILYNDFLGLTLLEKALRFFNLKYTSPSSKEITPFELGIEWLTGLGPRHRDFTDGDYFAELLRSHKHIQKLIKNASSILTQRCNDDCSFNILETLIDEAEGNYSLRGIKGVIEYIEDYSSLITGGMTGNLAVTYLGSYRAKVETKSISCCDNKAEILITINNSSTAASAFRPPVLGYMKLWKKYIEPRVNAFFSAGMGSQTTQTIMLNEVLQLSSTCGGEE